VIDLGSKVNRRIEELLIIIVCGFIEGEIFTV
jgi:hypothetical protein